MSIRPGRYTITNAQHWNLAFLSDSNDGTSLQACLKEDVPGQEWNVNEHENGRYSIVNFGHKMWASATFRPGKGEHVVGRERLRVWLIKEHDSGGKYTIATADDKLRWWLDSSWPETPVTLQDAPPSDLRCQWIFQKIGIVDTTPNEAAKEEAAAAQAELARTAREVEEAKHEAAQVKDEMVRTLAELEAARREVTKAKALAAENVMRREEAEAKASRMVAELNTAKEEVTQAKAEVIELLERLKVGRDRALAAAETTKGENMGLEEAKASFSEYLVKLESSRKAAEGDRGKPEGGRADAEAPRDQPNTKTYFGSIPLLDTGRYTSTNVVTPQLESGRYTITNVGAKNVAALADVKAASYIKGVVSQDRDTEKWNIVLLSNKKYTIKSGAIGLYANFEVGYDGYNVVGSFRPREWEIKQTRNPGHYVIFVNNPREDYWSLPDGREGTPIEFSHQDNSPKSQWFFTKV